MSWKYASLGALLNVVAAVATESAFAACDVDFDVAPAKKLSASMVRMYVPCPATIRHHAGPYINAETDGGVDACTPVFPQERYGDATPYRYGDAGGCEVKLSSKLTADCSVLEDGEGMPLGLPSVPCHVTSVKAKCSHIEDPRSFPIGAEAGTWTLTVLTRASIDDPANGPMTVMDLPMVFEFEPPANGSLKLSGTSAEALIDTGVFLPACTNLEILEMTIRDQNQNPFATMGGATRP